MTPKERAHAKHDLWKDGICSLSIEAATQAITEAVEAALEHQQKVTIALVDKAVLKERKECEKVAKAKITEGKAGLIPAAIRARTSK